MMYQWLQDFAYRVQINWWVFIVAGVSATLIALFTVSFQAVKAAWAQVINQYQRRADLVPNLVNTVKGYAAQEERVLVEVTEARSKATSIQLTPELINDPEAFKKFQAALEISFYNETNAAAHQRQQRERREPNKPPCLPEKFRND